MITKSVTIYDRADDGVYLHASAFTEMGALFAIPPYVHLSSSDRDRRIWAEVLTLLEKSGGHRAAPNDLEPIGANVSDGKMQGLEQLCQKRALLRS